MAKNPKEGKLLYHLTALENIESIFKNGLLPRNKIKSHFTNVADDRILEERNHFNNFWLTLVKNIFNKNCNIFV